LTTLLLCAAHGAIFLKLKTRGDVVERAGRAALFLVPASSVAVTTFIAWTLTHSYNEGRLGAPAVAVGIAASLAGAGAALLTLSRPGWGFIANGAAIALVFTTLFVDLYPNVLVSSTSDSFNLTLANAASGSYTLTVMTVVAAIFLPVVLLSQAWTYWVFRRRIGREDFGDVKTPIDLLERGPALIPARVPRRPKP
jgi:cytochrome d ubiquinol oxidase subunit II